MKSFTFKSLIGLAVVSTVVLNSCSTHQPKAFSRKPSSDNFTLRGEDEVKKYINTMKLLGGDGSISFASTWRKGNRVKSKDLIADAQQAVSRYNSGFQNTILESKATIETADVCERWEVYNATETRGSSSRQASTSSHNIGMKLSLSTAVAAAASGLAGVAGVIGSGGLGLAGIVGASAAGGGFFSGSAGFHSSGSSSRSSEEVKYYYVSRSVMCKTTAKYSRAVIKLTPDIFTLHPQQSAALIFGHIYEEMEQLNGTLTVMEKSLENLIETPIYTRVMFVEKFKDFFSVQMMKNNVVEDELALDAFKKDFKDNIKYLSDKIEALEANALIKETFQAELDQLKERQTEFLNTIVSFESDKVKIKVAAIELTLLNKNQLSLLGGTKLGSTIENSSLIDNAPTPFYDEAYAFLVKYRLPTSASDAWRTINSYPIPQEDVKKAFEKHGFQISNLYWGNDSAGEKDSHFINKAKEGCLTYLSNNSGYLYFICAPAVHRADFIRAIQDASGYK